MSPPQKTCLGEDDTENHTTLSELRKAIDSQPHAEPHVTSSTTAELAEGFFKLPPEIRLQIYALLLVNTESSDYWKHSTIRDFMFDDLLEKQHWADVYAQGINMDIAKYRSKEDRYIARSGRGMHPAILRVCKSIHQEAAPVLYSQNYFCYRPLHIPGPFSPESLLAFLSTIGPNIKYIRALDLKIEINRLTGGILWLQVLRVLAEKASGLRYLLLDFFARRFCALAQQGVPLRHWSDRGLGDNLGFVHALAKIQGLQTLWLRGFYSKSWPAYLSDKMRVRVEGRKGFQIKLVDEHPRKDLHRRKNRKESLEFEAYQKHGSFEGLNSLGDSDFRTALDV